MTGELLLFLAVSFLAVLYVFAILSGCLKATPPYRGGTETKYFGVSEKLWRRREFNTLEDARFWMKHRRILYDDNPVIWDVWTEIKFHEETDVDKQKEE